MQLVYARDTSTLSMSVDGSPVGSVNDVFASNVDEMRFFLVSPSNEFHIDAIPEPTSAVLALLGLSGLVSRRRRMRS